MSFILFRVLIRMPVSGIAVLTLRPKTNSLTHVFMFVSDLHLACQYSGKSFWQIISLPVLAVKTETYLLTDVFKLYRIYISLARQV